MRILKMLILACAIQAAWSQDVRMYSNTSESELLHVENTGSSSKNGINVITGTNDYVYGVYATGGTYGVGVYGQANTGLYGYGTSPDAYSDAIGVSGQANAGASSGSSIGVYGYAAYGAYQWAGYFSGDVYVGGYFDNPSDVMFKKNIRPLEGGLTKVMALKPRNYDMKVDEYKDKVSLPKGTQYGLIAQELETVLPDLVHSVKAPALLTQEERKRGVKREGTQFKSVNYIALIPVLVEAMQEQQAMIAALQTEVAALKRAK